MSWGFAQIVLTTMEDDAARDLHTIRRGGVQRSRPRNRRGQRRRSLLGAGTRPPTPAMAARSVVNRRSRASVTSQPEEDQVAGRSGVQPLLNMVSGWFQAVIGLLVGHPHTDAEVQLQIESAFKMSDIMLIRI